MNPLWREILSFQSCLCLWILFANIHEASANMDVWTLYFICIFCVRHVLIHSAHRDTRDSRDSLMSWVWQSGQILKRMGASKEKLQSAEMSETDGEIQEKNYCLNSQVRTVFFLLEHSVYLCFGTILNIYFDMELETKEWKLKIC